MYLAVVMDTFSRRVVGWHADKRMKISLISRAWIKAYNLRQPPEGLVFKGAVARSIRASVNVASYKASA